jgi:putative peptidoglycan lipid II flippase
MTGAALAIFGAGLPAFIWHKIFSPAFFAREDTRTPMNYALISIAINTALALALFPTFGFLSVAFATVVAAWVQVALLAQRLYRNRHFQPGGRLAGRILRVALASAGLAAFLHMALSFLDPIAALFWGRDWVAVIVVAGAGLIAYAVLALALGAAKLSDYKTVAGA